MCDFAGWRSGWVGFRRGAGERRVLDHQPSHLHPLACPRLTTTQALLLPTPNLLPPPSPSPPASTPSPPSPPAASYVPKPVVTGFTAGIATYIFSTQLKDFLGLGAPGRLPEGVPVPTEFLEKVIYLGEQGEGRGGEGWVVDTSSN